MIGERDQIKLIDFGLAAEEVTDDALKSIAGTPYYMAPEVLNGEYGKQCDVWSLGVVLYVMLCGYLPFSADNTRALIAKIKEGLFTFPITEWRHVSMDAKDLIKNMLVVDPLKRYTIQKCINHAWFGILEDEKTEISGELVKSLLAYKKGTRFRKAAMNIFVKLLKD